jgi:hypothetical protein
MNLPTADPQLELSAVELRPTVQKLRTQHLLIPLSGLFPIADLDINVLYHRDSGHGCTSCCLRFAPLRIAREFHNKIKHLKTPAHVLRQYSQLGISQEFKNPRTRAPQSIKDIYNRSS